MHIGITAHPAADMLHVVTRSLLMDNPVFTFNLRTSAPICVRMWALIFYTIYPLPRSHQFARITQVHKYVPLPETRLPGWGSLWVHLIQPGGCGCRIRCGPWQFIQDMIQAKIPTVDIVLNFDGVESVSSSGHSTPLVLTTGDQPTPFLS